jgi:anti-sigma factor RsiW
MLKKLSCETGLSEAELVRRALEAQLNTCMAAGHNLKAWEAEKAFIEDRLRMHRETPHPSTEIGRSWQRDDLHER